MNLRRFWLLGTIILWAGLTACLPGEAVVTETAVSVTPQQPTPTVPALPSELPATETAVPPTAPPTRQPTATPIPTVTPEPTATRPDFTPIIPQTYDFFSRVAILPDTPLGQIIHFRPALNDATTLELITSNSYERINVTTGEVTVTLALPDSRIIGVDNAGTIWLLVGNDNDTIFALDQTGTQRSFSAASGWLPLVGTARDLVQDANGDIWLSTNEDVRRFDGTQWTIYTREALGMAAPSMEDVGVLFHLAYSPLTQTVWVGECDWVGPGPIGGGGVRWFDGTLWHGSDSPVARGCSLDIVEGNNGRIWVALNAQLWQFHPADSSWEQFLAPESSDELRIGYIEKLLLDSQNNPWPLFSLCGGASCQVAFAQYRLRDGEWTQFGDAFIDPPLLVFNSDNLPFFFYNKQMMFYTLNDEAIQFPQVELAVPAAFLDDDDNLWIVGRPSPDLPLIIWQAHMRG